MTETKTSTPNPSVLTLAATLRTGALTAALINERGRVLAQLQSELKSQTTRTLVPALARLLVELAHAEARGAAVISAIGLSVSGLIDPATKRVTSEAWKWTRVPLGQLVETALDEVGYDIRQPAAANHARAETRASGHPPISVHPYLAALAAAESWVGAARAKRHVIYLNLDDAIECGILLDGRALLGADGLAGAVSWLAVAETFKNDYAAQGCLKSEAGQGALVRRTLEEYSGEAHTMLGSLISETPQQLTPELIVRAARGGDKLALHVVTNHCHSMARGLANLISLLNPEVVVLGGTFGKALDPFLDEIRAETRRWAAPAAGRACHILGASVSQNAELIGAARLAQPV